MMNDFNKIKKYIPQREPMIMVGDLLSYEETIAKSSFVIDEDNIFVKDGCFSEAGLLENMAQTAALGKGYEFSLLHKAVPLGFIGGVRNFVVKAIPKVNDELQTIITVKHKMMNVTMADAQVFVDDVLQASCELKIFINPETS